MTRNSIVRSPQDMTQRLVPIQGYDVAQVAEEFQPPDADYWEEIMPQFDLDGTIAEGDILVEEIACNMIEPDLIDDKDQGFEFCIPVEFQDSNGATTLKGNVQGKNDIHQIYDGTNLNAQGCCHDADSL